MEETPEVHQKAPECRPNARIPKYSNTYQLPNRMLIRMSSGHCPPEGWPTFERFSEEVVPEMENIKCERITKQESRPNTSKCSFLES